MPDQATRRSYLAAYFGGVTPGPAHERIAELIAAGFIRVVVTTNFDRLLEDALIARGVDPVVVSDDATLEAAPRREHVACFILKVHGDYRQETIRNVPGELAVLEPAVTAELQAILDHYAVVVVGYSGSDAAIAACLRARRSRYGLWWLSITATLAEPAASLVESIGGRAIVRPGAAQFIASLRGQLDVYDRHPSGHTPASVHDEIVGLLRRRDGVGLDEALRRERQSYDTRLRAWTEAHVQGLVDENALVAAGDELVSVIERRLAGVLPLALHDDARFRTEVRALINAVERQPRLGGAVLAMHPAEWGAWWIGYVAGALLVRSGRWELIDSIALSAWQRDGVQMTMLEYAGETGSAIANAYYRERNPRFLAPTWEYLREKTSELAWLRERYAELFEAGSPINELAAMDFVASCISSVRGDEVVAHWTMNLAGAERVALQLYRDVDARASVARAAGVEPDHLGVRFSAAIAERRHNYPRVHFIGNFPRWQAAVNLLTFGQREPPRQDDG